MKKLIVILVIFMSVLVAQGGISQNTSKYPWLPDKWYNLAVCESGSNPPNWKHRGGPYQGAFGFWYGTWDQYRYKGMPREAYNATPRQQYKVALRVYAAGGYWGCFNHYWVKYGPRVE